MAKAKVEESAVVSKDFSSEYSPQSKVNKTIFIVVRTTNQADGTQNLEVKPLTVEYIWDAEKREVVGFKGETLKIRPSQTVEGVFD